MTKDEARQKWCPFARYDDGDGVAFNRSCQIPPSSFSGAKCIADDCMMWRKHYKDEEEHGYCGLAG